MPHHRTTLVCFAIALTIGAASLSAQPTPRLPAETLLDRAVLSAIRDAVSAEFQPVDLKAVAEYIDVLAKAGAVSFKP